MANPTVVINSVQYGDCPEVDIPKVGGGTAKFYYTGDANGSSADLVSGKNLFGPNGSVSGSMTDNGDVSGTISTKAGTVSIPAGKTSGGTVSILASAVEDLTSSSLLSGKTVLGIQGSLAMPSISQDATSKILSIS